MSFGFQLFDENGGLALDDKAFSIIGRDAVLSGGGTFPIYPEFVALGVSGAELVGKNLYWHFTGSSVGYAVSGASTMSVVVFEDSSKSVASPVMGLEVFSEDGLKTFSSGDRHFEILSNRYMKNTSWSPTPIETLDKEVIYILHSLFPRPVGQFPIGGGRFGVRMGQDQLSATSTELAIAPYETWGVPAEIQELSLPNPQYTSQLLKVRAK